MAGSTSDHDAEPGAPGGRRVTRARPLPNTRAVVGGLLVTLAGLATFAAYSGAAGDTGSPVVVAANDLRPGAALEAGDLDVVELDLGDALDGHVFVDPASLIGREVLAPIAEGELVQAGAVTDQASPEPGTELALVVPRDHVAAGRLELGDRVDVYASGDAGTDSVATGLLVVDLALDADRLDEADVEVVVIVRDPRTVALVVDALRSAEITLVRSTFDSSGGPDDDGAPARSASAGGS